MGDTGGSMGRLVVVEALRVCPFREGTRAEYMTKISK